MSRRPTLDANALVAAREAFLRRHEGFCGETRPDGRLYDPERLAYLDDTIAEVIRTYQGAAAQPDLFVRRPVPVIRSERL